MQKKGSSTTSKSDDGQPIKKSRKSSSCPFLDSKVVQLVRDLSLTEVTDVESLILSGKKKKACPYYAARNAICDAQVFLSKFVCKLRVYTSYGWVGSLFRGKLRHLTNIINCKFILNFFQLVVVPYSTLLKKHTREACGLKLHNNVVIIVSTFFSCLNSFYTVIFMGILF